MNGGRAWLLGCLLALPVQAETAPPRIDLAHFWIAPSERASLDLIAQRFIARGGVWSDTPSPDYEFMKRDSVMRITAGFPPSAMWLGAEDIASLGVLGVATRLNDLAEEDGWRRHLHDFIWPVLYQQGELVGLPVTLHNENWAWFNAKLYRRLHLPLPKTWDEVLAQAPVFMRAGVLPLAISDQPWNVRLLFTTLMAGAAGPELYRRLYIDEDPSVFDHPRVLRVLEILERLRAYRPPAGEVRTWNAATTLVIQGRAAMQVMGDWAKGEFKKVGPASAQQDFVCAPVPEAQRSFIAALDMLSFPRVRDLPSQAGQRLLARLMLEPELQAAFAHRKGSLPVRRDIAATQLDACAADSLARLNEASTRLLSPRALTSEQVRVALQAELAAFWNRPGMTVEELRQRLRQAMRK